VANLPRPARREDSPHGVDHQATMSATVATRRYTPLALREPPERWLIASFALLVAALYLFVIPLEIALH
jgi:hypothetical protein